jgi:hypothetical protein
MLTELQAEVPAVDGVPTTAQYTNAIEDAVIDFSRRCGVTKISTLAIVSGTAVYSLATDFLKLINLDALVGVDGVMFTNGGLIPVSKDFEEVYTIVNKQITFFPTPGYSMTRYYRYKSAWVATGGDYTTLGEEETQIVLLLAKSKALMKIANDQAGDSIKYSFGAVSEDLSGGSDTSRKNANDIEREYVDACERYNGSHVAYG